MKKILAVETSCDDTSVAIVREDHFVLFNKTIGQNTIHTAYGGVVPELASRNHSHHLLPLIEKALNETGYTWSDIDGFAVTNRPGLVGSLIVGLVTIKSLSVLLDKAYIAVNHIEGHILSPLLWDKKSQQKKLSFPFLCLIVSGGHTHLFLVKNFRKYYLISKTRDDSAGEALDKVARLLGLAYPGGAEIDKISQSVMKEKNKYSFPKTILKNKQELDFSFSGLKTFAVNLISKIDIHKNPEEIPIICKNFQETVVDQILDRLNKALPIFKPKHVVIAGGVSANSRLRAKADIWAREKQVDVVFPPLKYCTDNAAMIGLAGIEYLKKGITSPQDLNCFPSSLPEDFN